MTVSKLVDWNVSMLLVAPLVVRSDCCKAVEMNSAYDLQCELQGPSLTPKFVAVHLETAQIPPTFVLVLFYPITSDLEFDLNTFSLNESEIGAQCSPT